MKSLEAVYKGYRFRSRAEARWFIFYSLAGVEATYESEAIDLGGFVYIPDYWLDIFRAWAEIKGHIANDQAGLLMLDKCTKLAVQSGRPVILNFRDPLDARCIVFRGDKMYSQSRWTHCDHCGGLALGVRSDNFHCVWCPRMHNDPPLTFDALRSARRRLYEAALTARQHRFGVSKSRAANVQ